MFTGGSSGILAVSLAKDGSGLFLTAQPAAAIESNDSAEARRRQITWNASLDSFMQDTRAQNKIKTLALLIDNMVLDYVKITLAPEGALKTPARDTADYSNNEPSGPIPMIPSDESQEFSSTSAQSANGEGRLRGKTNILPDVRKSWRIPKCSWKMRRCNWKNVRRRLRCKKMGGTGPIRL
ncbi:MAG: hypothetical protein JXR76_00270 [Deltaproteobacteria bacterium]|nr:hypothetical protein [Deltaproteobacteria bacterium]